VIATSTGKLDLNGMSSEKIDATILDLSLKVAKIIADAECSGCK
jgi:hypothetical protein